MDPIDAEQPNQAESIEFSGEEQLDLNGLADNQNINSKEQSVPDDMFAGDNMTEGSGTDVVGMFGNLGGMMGGEGSDMMGKVRGIMGGSGGFGEAVSGGIMEKLGGFMGAGMTEMTSEKDGQSADMMGKSEEMFVPIADGHESSG